MARILVAEDDLATCMTIRSTLEGLGHTVLLSQDGQHAWETLQVDERIELVVTDIAMPRTDGRELIRLIRGTERLRSLPVIIISGVVSAKEISDLLKLGASKFQPKPLAPDLLRAYVRNCLCEGTSREKSTEDES